jgi:hypothetical protein
MARALVAAGVPARPCPWAEIVGPADAEALDRALAAPGVEVLLVTSANAVRFAAPARLAGRKAACVGAATAAAARKAGCDVGWVGTAGAKALAIDLILARRPGSALWLRGERARRRRVLRAARWTVAEAIAYATRPTPTRGGGAARRHRALLSGPAAGGHAAPRPPTFPPRPAAPRFVSARPPRGLAHEGQPTRCRGPRRPSMAAPTGQRPGRGWGAAGGVRPGGPRPGRRPRNGG